MENMEEGHGRKRQISPNERFLYSAIVYYWEILPLLHTHTPFYRTVYVKLFHFSQSDLCLKVNALSLTFGNGRKYWDAPTHYS